MLDIQKNISLAKYTTFRIGGPAKFFAEIKTKDDLIDAVKWSKENNEKIFILGGGSNVLFNDKGFDGLVIYMANRDFEILKNENSSSAKVLCGAGTRLSVFALKLAGKSLSGLEWAVGIPGATVAGAIRGNAEALSGSMGSLVEEVEIFDLDSLEFKILKPEDCKFSYRESIFKEKRNYLIWGATLIFKKEEKKIIDKLIANSINHRKSSYPSFPSAGSTFKNAISLEQLKERNKKIAQYALDNKIVNRLGNVGTGFLVDYLGLKGSQVGGAQISEKHGNFIVNTGNATAEDVIMLSSLIKQKVRDEIGVQLEEEIELVGF